MMPSKVVFQVLLRLEAFDKLDDMKIGHIDPWELRGIEILLGVQYILFEEVLVNFSTILLQNQDGRGLLWRWRWRFGARKERK